jgi:HAD superfamily hydrolase (TIGR01509 family)
MPAWRNSSAAVTGDDCGHETPFIHSTLGEGDRYSRTGTRPPKRIRERLVPLDVGASTPTLAAVFLDLDGTLIDSETIWNESIRWLVDQHGSAISEVVLARTHGLEVFQALRLVHDSLGWPLDQLETHVACVARRVADSYRARVPWRPGAQSLLCELRTANIPTALVTSSYRELVEIILCGLDGSTFDAVVCGDEVTSPKPHPEPYLTAASLLGVDVRACVAIEDSPNGAASAKAAGCTVLYIGALCALPTVDAARMSLLDVDPAGLARLGTPPPTRGDRRRPFGRRREFR